MSLPLLLPDTTLPTVLPPVTLPALLNHILDSKTPATHTTLLICSSRAQFLENILYALQKPHEKHTAEAQRLAQSLTPTLQTLFTAQNVRLSYCASLQALLAYLSAYNGGEHTGTGTKRLILVNPLALHASTSAYSAQGLSRTFAAAVETAKRIGARLVIVECIGLKRERNFDLDEQDTDVVMGDDEMSSQQSNGEGSHGAITSENPWDQEVPILNVSARRFGSGNGDRSWAGRKVKIMNVAARWCYFHPPEHTAEPAQEEN